MSYIEWAALGVFLVLLELFVPGTYLIWFGIAGLIVSIIVYFYTLSLTIQLITFALFSAVFAYIGLICYRKIMKKIKENGKYRELNDLASQYVGQTVTLNQDVVDGKTKVKVGDTVWLAESDKSLKKGDSVVITGVKNGLIFTVKPK